MGKSGLKWGQFGKSEEKLEKVGKSNEKWEKVGKSSEKWRKSLSITFLAISDQYGTLFFFQNGRQQPFWIPIFAKIDRDLPL